MRGSDGEHTPLVAGPNKRGIPWVEIVAAVLVLLGVCLFGSAQAQTCPGPPTSTLTSVEYDPLSVTDTVKNFTMSMPPGTGYAGTVGRHIRIWKQLEGSETENVSYRFSRIAGGNLTFFSNSEDRDMSFLGWAWRGNGTKSTQVAFGILPAGVSGNANFTILLPKTQNLLPGLTSIKFASVAAYSEFFDTTVCPYYYGGSATAEQSFTLNVASAMALSLAGGGTSGTIDFGNTLATAATRSVNLRLRSNVAYKVTMDSAYNGVLKLNNTPNATEQIAYTTTLNGTPISETTQFTNTNPTGTGGADITLPFEVTIGDTSNARAGFYKDIVTLTISSGL
jgi:hypothetical protein